MPQRVFDAAMKFRERELHLERLRSIEQRRGRPSTSSAATAPWRAPPVPKPGPRPLQHGPRAANYTTKSHEVRLEQKSHARRMQDLMDRTARRQDQHLERALTAGRAKLGTTTARRRIQDEIAAENVVLRRHIRAVQPRLASPSAIALLKGSGKAKLKGVATDGEEEDA